MKKYIIVKILKFVGIFILANLLSVILVFPFFYTGNGMLVLIASQIALGLAMFILTKYAFKISEYKLAKATIRQSVLIIICGVILSIGNQLLLGNILPKPEIEQKILTDVLSNIYFGVISAIIVAPILEEYIFRYVLRNIIKKDNMFVWTSAILFSLIHIQITKYGWYTNIYPVILIFLVGYILAYSYKKTNRLLVPILIHSLMNSIAIILHLF